MNPSTELYYNSPAADWNDALPVGNGRMGGMVFGKPADELIQLNEDSLWSGGFRNRNNPKAYDNLEKITHPYKGGKDHRGGRAVRRCVLRHQ